MADARLARQSVELLTAPTPADARLARLSTEVLTSEQSFATISPLAVPSEETLGSPSVQLPSEVRPVGVASAEAGGVPAVQLTPEVRPSGSPSAETFGLPAVGDPGTATYRVKVDGVWVTISRH